MKNRPQVAEAAESPEAIGSTDSHDVVTATDGSDVTGAAEIKQVPRRVVEKSQQPTAAKWSMNRSQCGLSLCVTIFVASSCRNQFVPMWEDDGTVRLVAASIRETVKPVRCADLGWQPEVQDRHRIKSEVLANCDRWNRRDSV